MGSSMLNGQLRSNFYEMERGERLTITNPSIHSLVFLHNELLPPNRG